MTRGWAAALVMIMLLLCVPACAQGMDAQEMDARVDKVFADTRTVGGAFLVAQRGELVYERYYGVQQKTTGVPVTEKTVFRCASVTKLVTGIKIPSIGRKKSLTFGFYR